MQSDRRNFIRIIASAGAGLVGAPLLTACAAQSSGGGQPEAQGALDGGNVSDLALSDPRTLAEPVVVIRDDGGVYAMTTICTHAQCDMSHSGSISAAGLHCSCHGSSFDLQGNATQGPARTPLAHYAVDIDAGGEITVQAGEVVPADRRVDVASV